MLATVSFGMGGSREEVVEPFERLQNCVKRSAAGLSVILRRWIIGQIERRAHTTRAWYSWISLPRIRSRMVVLSAKSYPEHGKDPRCTGGPLLGGRVRFR